MRMESKYLVFMGDDYYPSGGWDDFVCYFNTIEEAREYLESQDCDYKWAHVVHENKIILRGAGKLVDFRNFYWIFADED